jgi:hypothetical protein
MRKFSLILLLHMSLVIQGQERLESVVKQQALEMGKAMVNGDSRKFARYMLPEVLEAAGGEDKVAATIDSMFAMFKTFGGNVSKITYGNPGRIVKYKNELQTTIPQTTAVTSSIADVEFSGTLVAVSRDKGKNWYFYDTSMGRSEKLKDKLPNLSPEIVIPPMTQPKFTPKEDLKELMKEGQ